MIGRPPTGEYLAQKEDFPALSAVTGQPKQLANSDRIVEESNNGAVRSRVISDINSGDNGSKDSRFGLLGLLEVIRMTDKVS